MKKEDSHTKMQMTFKILAPKRDSDLYRRTAIPPPRLDAQKQTTLTQNTREHN